MSEFMPIKDLADKLAKIEAEKEENTATVEATTEGVEAEVSVEKWHTTFAAFLKSTWSGKPTAGVKVEKKF